MSDVAGCCCADDRTPLADLRVPSHHAVIVLCELKDAYDHLKKMQKLLATTYKNVFLRFKVIIIKYSTQVCCSEGY